MKQRIPFQKKKIKENDRKNIMAYATKRDISGLSRHFQNLHVTPTPKQPKSKEKY